MTVLVFRVMLGVNITFKGLIFLANVNYLDTLLRQNRLRITESVWVYYIPYTSLLSGVIFITGLFTRWAVQFQIPVLIGTLFFINRVGGVFGLNGALLQSLVVLVMLIYFLFQKTRFRSTIYTSPSSTISL